MGWSGRPALKEALPCPASVIIDDVSEWVEAKDKLPALSAGPWWKDKHYYVRCYGDIFSTGMSLKWDTRVYIDLFAGPGRATIEESGEEIDGSPLIALRQRKGFTHYFFADKNREYMNALRHRSEQAAPSALVRYYVDDCNRAAGAISRDLPAGRGWLGLAFLDPYRWEISLDSIRELTKGGRRLDLMVTLHIANMIRCADDNPAELADFFGDQAWHAEYLKRTQQGIRRWRVLRELYQDRLRSLDYTHVNNDVLVRRPDGHPMYYLIFASRHELGETFWQRISARSRRGQHRLFE